MKTKILSVLLLLALMFNLLVVTQPVQAAPVALSPKGVSPAGMLNTDGTLNLSGGFNGTLDLSGFNVQMDSKRGPVFTPSASVTPGDWAGIGDGGGALDGYIRAIAVKGTDIYVGGGFTNAANISEADYIAKWDGAAWSALGDNGAGDGSLSNDVQALAFVGNDLYVGGDFGQVYNHSTILSTAYIAKWNIVSGDWSAVGSDGTGGASLNNGVKAIAVSGTDVFVGGRFTDVIDATDGTLNAADYVAKWNGTKWSALGSNGSSDGSFSSTTYISSLAVSGSSLYVGGQFSDVNNNGTILYAADNVVHWDGANWSALGSDDGLGGNGSIGGTVYALVTDASGNLYVGGQFTGVNNNGTVLNSGDWLVKWNGSNWSALGYGATTSDGALDNYVYVLAMDASGNLYAGGAFTNVNDKGTVLTAADYLVKWDGANWSALGNNGAAGNGSIPNKSNSVVMAIAANGSNVIVGGGFYDLNNGGSILTQADYLAQWSGSSWSAFGSEPNGALANGYSGSQVYAVAVDSMGNIYVGGRFQDVSNHGTNLYAADYIAKWDGVDWSALGSNGAAGNGSLTGSVYALATIGTEVYVGGQFQNVNNGGTTLNTADYIAKWNGSNWSALGDNGFGNGALSASVSALAVNGSYLYVGGGFTNAAGIAEADYVAKLDTLDSIWSAMGNNGAGDGALNDYVSAIAIDGSSNVYVGGGFTNAAGIHTADYVAKWSAGAWSSLGSNGAGDGSLNNSVQALAVRGSTVYAGGTFTNVRNGLITLNTADLIAEWDGTNWSPLGGNGILGDGVFCVACGNSVRAIFVSGTDVYVGGNFTNINSQGATLNAADYIARWDGASWSALGDNGTGGGAIEGTNGVYAITAVGNDLLVGGSFSNPSNHGVMAKTADYLAAYGMTINTPDTTPPTVNTIKRTQISPATSAASVDFIVTFSEPVYIPWATDFVITASGVSGAAVTGFSGSGSVYTVHVSTGGGSGTIRLDVTDTDIIVDAAGNYLGGTGSGNGNFTTGESYTVSDVTPPTVQSITRVFSNPANGTFADFRVAFSEAVTGVDTTSPFADFSLTTSGVSSAAISDVTLAGDVYFVRVNTGTGDGTIKLNILDDNTIVDLASNPLGGATVGDGDFSTGETYDIDKTPPSVVSINLVNPTPTDFSSVQFTVNFSKPVTGVDLSAPFSDFALASSSGISGAAITGISGSGSTYTVTVNTGAGDGTLGLNLVDDDSITDSATNQLGGAGTANGNFTGAVYTVDKITHLEKNGGFETYTGKAKIPSSWLASKNFAATDGKNKTFKTGKYSVMLTGTGAVKTLAQLPAKNPLLNISGAKGDVFTFSYWVKGSAIPKTGGLCQGQVLFYVGSSVKGFKTLPCPTGTYSKWKSKSVVFPAPVAYTSVAIKFTYSKPGGVVWFDEVILTK